MQALNEAQSEINRLFGDLQSCRKELHGLRNQLSLGDDGRKIVKTKQDVMEMQCKTLGRKFCVMYTPWLERDTIMTDPPPPPPPPPPENNNRGRESPAQAQARRAYTQYTEIIALMTPKMRVFYNEHPDLFESYVSKSHSSEL